MGSTAPWLGKIGNRAANRSSNTSPSQNSGKDPTINDAVPATLLAVCAWLRGDGAMANIALARAVASDPGYAFARLLSDALAACLTPSDLRALLVEAGPTPPGG